MTNLLTDAATASVLTPVGIAIASELALDPVMLLALIGTCISFTFLNPFSHQSNLMSSARAATASRRSPGSVSRFTSPPSPPPARSGTCSFAPRQTDGTPRGGTEQRAKRPSPGVGRSRLGTADGGQNGQTTGTSKTDTTPKSRTSGSPSFQ